MVDLQTISIISIGRKHRKIREHYKKWQGTKKSSKGAEKQVKGRKDEKNAREQGVKMGREQGPRNPQTEPHYLYPEHYGSIEMPIGMCSSVKPVKH